MKMDDKYYLKIGRAADLKDRKERVMYRFFEMVVPLFSISILLLAVVFSFKLPFVVAVLIIAYDLMWLFRTVYFYFFLRSGYARMKKNEKEDWIKRLDELGTPKNGLIVKNWRKDIYHLLILPTYKEPIELVDQTFKLLSEVDYPKDKMIVVLACEESDKEHATEVSKIIGDKYGKQFFKFLVTWHPKGIPGEVPGHGANDAWASKEVKKQVIDPLNIPYENIIVSSFDIDACVYPKYFSCLTYIYLTVDRPCRASYQPIPLYLNNVWHCPVISRVFSFSATFWHTMNQEQPEKLITFSSHSMSFKALSDVGFKQVNVVSDDSRIFWQCFFEYDGDYRVEPMFYPISMDANCGQGTIVTLKNIYKQQKRWAYGVGEVPYYIFAAIKNKKISFKKKVLMGWDLVEGHVSWAVSSILIFALGWLPIFVGGAEFSKQLISYNLPKATSTILTINMLGLIGSIYLSMMILPKRPKEVGILKYVVMVLEWALIPFVTIFLSSLPALHAQLHWLTGKYMGFWVTPKVRKK
jgi:cellulose synthase/poly-beta-1,6-N-acetylglucosamine synthase-like glycosyltransferase